MLTEIVHDTSLDSTIEHDLRMRIATFPHDANAWYLLGCHLFKLGRLEDAEHALETAITLNPNVHIFRAKLQEVLARLESVRVRADE